MGDQSIQKHGLVKLPSILIPAFILLRNLLKQHFTEKGEAAAPLAHPLNSLMWRAEVLALGDPGAVSWVEHFIDPTNCPWVSEDEVLEKSAFFLF